jgi:ubiquinone/menaquinone biosynthesis C-methylase UbiE
MLIIREKGFMMSLSEYKKINTNTKGNVLKHKSKFFLLRYINEKFKKDLIDFVLYTNPYKILDLGCGEGLITKDIAINLPNSSIIGIDFDNEYINYAKTNNQKENITYINYNLFEIKYPKNSFDLVITTEVLEHINDFEKALQNMLNLTKKYLIISVPYEPWFRIANMLRFKYLSSFGNNPGHINHWSKNQIRKLCQKYGHVVKIKTSTFWNIVIIEKLEIN